MTFTYCFKYVQYSLHSYPHIFISIAYPSDINFIEIFSTIKNLARNASVNTNCDLLGEKVPKVGWQITELHSSKQNTGSLMKKLILLFSATPLWVPFLPAGHNYLIHVEH